MSNGQTTTAIQAWCHDMVKYAVRVGKMVRQPCEVCGKETHVHAHHDDYLKPREVRWLCITHHRAWHKEHGPAANADAPVPHGQFNLWFPDGREPEFYENGARNHRFKPYDASGAAPTEPDCREIAKAAADRAAALPDWLTPIQTRTRPRR